MPTPTYAHTVNDTTVRIGELSQPRELIQTVTVSKVSGGTISIDTEIAAIQAEGHIPTINTSYVPTPLSGMTWEPYLVCRSLSYTAVAGSNAIRFTVTWSTMYVDDIASETASYVLPSQTDYATRTRTSNIYRSGWTTAPSDTNASTDIGGTAVTGGTQPKVELVPQISMRVRITQDAALAGMSTVATWCSSYLNKINSASFAGFAAGTVVCEGVTVQKLSTGYEFYEIIFEFLVDSWFHLDQVPESDERGLPKLTSGVPSVVKWMRTSRSTVDFNAIFGSDTNWKYRTLDGWWAP